MGLWVFWRKPEFHNFATLEGEDMRKKLKDRYRKPNRDMIRARQVPRLAVAFRTWWIEHRGRWDYLGERIGLEGLINAFVADFMTWPPAERVAYFDRAVPKAEMLELEWIAEMDRKIAAGELEPEFPYEPIRAAQQRPEDAPKSAGGHGVGRPRTPGRKRA